ncbi:HTH-type transcriptional repressor RspR (plasmid) [Sulfitobacter sp. DSM 110093]|uniref:GntR family transcriptional regulator n=1 Tax=Sulfitobacter sp. DSM 110093 TaxID=2883127 RepID=UPI001FAE034A|nr:FCD domain-containing protein [Sulfitobacter sp. DSM 110093]UOA33663.1 HTH-type transcriptional repressor RspR [Sulfitobacter sp. DSM 110093]UOA33924.1 HTH-type transcriptional repressor RspR [Sulfitobacter sp. DSM 110093]
MNKKANPGSENDRLTDQNRIIAEIESDIIFGHLHPREHLVEDQLIERFATTRHKVRTALTELIQRGLVVQVRNKGARVQNYTADEVRGLYDIRNALQTQAIKRMAFPLKPEVVRSLQDLHEEHITAGENGALQEMYELNNRFHEVFFEACELPVLANAIRDYAFRTHPIRSRGFYDDTYRCAAQDDHADIVAEAASQDDGAQERLIQINLRHTNRPRDMYLSANFPSS